MGIPFKYQHEIDEMLNDGHSMPHLNTIDRMDSYRYVFSNDMEHSNLPAYVINPKRKLKAPKLIGYSLSCFATEQAAENNYIACLDHFPKFEKTAGDSLAEIVLDSKDGMITKPDEKLHFSLFEYRECDLNQKTHVLKHF